MTARSPPVDHVKELQGVSVGPLVGVKRKARAPDAGVDLGHFLRVFARVGNSPRKDKALGGTEGDLQQHLNPDAAFVTQQARNLCLAERLPTNVRFLIRERDSKYTRSFDAIFETEGARVILTPIRSPRANAFAERWVRTVRSEVLDWTLVLGRRHLDHLLARYAEHYNSHRPHRGIALAPPDACGVDPPLPAGHKIRRRAVLAGINEYLAA